jgi:threonylcarbamoyladenosine tRNA methylthiotransferase MtaB
LRSAIPEGNGPANDLRGLKVWICALGCRSNFYEASAIADGLLARGARVSGESDGCEAAVIVTCAVTATADKKCRQAVRRARRELDRAGGRGRGKILAVCGCWAQTLPAGEARKMGIGILVGNRLKHLLPDAIAAASGDGFLDLRRDPCGAGDAWDALSLSRPLLRTRVFLKVQEGCDRFCSYCVIPFLRGRPVSRPLGETLAEARRVVEAGCREIVLTGIHLGAYGHGGASLGDLVRRLSEIPGLARLRLGSLEPFALDEDLLDALGSSPVFCPHLHLPAQSGDDAVLERMGRGYTADGFVRVCDLARKKLGGELHVSTDVLAAFPGESEEAFHNTLALLERAGVGRVHVFPYSPREGTAAARFPGRVPPRAASERVEAATALGARLLNRYASRFVGRRVSVLAETVEPSLTGYSPHFVAVSASPAGEGETPKAGQEAEVRVTGCAGGELRGEIAEGSPSWPPEAGSKA